MRTSGGTSPRALMGARTSKTRPTQSPVQSQSHDTVVQTFDMGTVDELQNGVALWSNSSSNNVGVGAGVGVGSAGGDEKRHGYSAKSAMVQGILEGRIDNNMAPLSSLYGTHSTAPELEVSSSEDEDDEVDGASPHRKKKQKKKLARKKKKTQVIETKVVATPAKTLKPVKPPPHPPNQHTPVVPLVTLKTASTLDNIGIGTSDNESGVAGRSVDGSPTPKAQVPPTGKADSPSRFFGFSMSRRNLVRPPTGTKEKTTSARAEEPLVVSLNASASASLTSKVRMCACVVQFVRLREGIDRCVEERC